jgi:hypothetical protein
MFAQKRKPQTSPQPARLAAGQCKIVSKYRGLRYGSDFRGGAGYSGTIEVDAAKPRRLLPSTS